MAPHSVQDVKITLDDGTTVSGLLEVPPQAKGCFVLGHGAGAGMRHAFMTAIAADLASQAIATLRYQFPYMEKCSKRPDAPALCHATVRAAVDEAARQVPNLPLIAGGKSFGGRMTSQAQAAVPLRNVHGLAFVGFPLHPDKRPSDTRAAHLFDVQIPMLFLQGTRDGLADLGLLMPLIERLGTRATLETVQDADHSFHVPARSGRTDADVRIALAQAVSRWVDSIIGQ